MGTLATLCRRAAGCQATLLVRDRPDQFSATSRVLPRCALRVTLRSVARELDDEIRDALGGRGAPAFAMWQAAAGVLGVVLPTLLASRQRHRWALAEALLVYRNLLLRQIALETAVTRARSPSLAVPAGIVFTSVRLVQLRRLARLASGSGASGPPVPAARRLALVATAFWAGNLAFLVGWATPRVIRLRWPGSSCPGLGLVGRRIGRRLAEHLRGRGRSGHRGGRTAWVCVVLATSRSSA